jgi:hypothetical protein
MVLTLTSGDRQIVDAGEVLLLEPVRIEIPILIAAGPKPLSARVMSFVGKPDGDEIVRKGPDLLDQAVVRFTHPFGAQKGDDLYGRP